MGFRSKQILVLTLVAACVALATNLVHVLLFARVHVAEALSEAQLLARALDYQTRRVVDRQPHETLASDPALRHYADAVVGYSPTALYLAVVDEQGIALFHTDARQQGLRVAEGEPLRKLSEQSPPVQLWRILTERLTLVADVPFLLDGEPAAARVAVSSLLLRNHILRDLATGGALATAIVLAAFLGSLYLANRLLAPMQILRRELARIDTGAAQPRLDLLDDADVGRIAEFFASIGRKLRAERQRDDTEQTWLDGLVGAMTDAVLVLDVDRRIASLNAPASDLLGQDASGLLGRRLEEAGANAALLDATAAEALKREKNIGPGSLHLDTQGRKVEHLIGAQFLQLPSGAPGVVVTARNVEPLSRLGSRLSHSQKLSALGRVASGVAHEIRNPLNTMVLKVALLRKQIAEQMPDLERHLDTLDREVRHLDRVVEGFLTFTRPEELRLESVRLEQVLREVAEQFSARFEASAIRCEWEAEPDLKPVWGSAGLLQQAFTNLVANACDAMPGGGRLRLALHRQPGSVEVEVEDSGAGIPAEALPKIFELYYTTKDRGNGIGLALVHRIVELHGGEVTVDSRQGAGTRFNVTLPEVRF